MSLEAMLSEKDITKATNEALKEQHNNEISDQRQELARETSAKQSVEHQLAKAHATINSLQKALEILQAEWKKKVDSFAKKDDRVSLISAKIESRSGQATAPRKRDAPRVGFACGDGVFDFGRFVCQEGGGDDDARGVSDTCDV